MIEWFPEVWTGIVMERLVVGGAVTGCCGGQACAGGVERVTRCLELMTRAGAAVMESTDLLRWCILVHTTDVVERW